MDEIRIGGDMERKEKRVVLFSSDRSGDMPTSDLAGFVAWASGLLASVPEQYRSSATIDIDSSVYYDCAVTEIVVYYCRPETDDEMAEREQYEARRVAESEAQERREFERLAAKFGKG